MESLHPPLVFPSEFPIRAQNDWVHYPHESNTQGHVDTLWQHDTSRTLSYQDANSFSALPIGKAIYVVAMDNTETQRQIFQEFLDNSGDSVALSPITPETSACPSMTSSTNSLLDSERTLTQNLQIISGYSGSQPNGCPTAVDQMAYDPMTTSIYGEESLAQLFQGPNPSAVDEMADILMGTSICGKEGLAQLSVPSNISSSYTEPLPLPPSFVSPQPFSLNGTVGTTPDLIQLQKHIQGQAWLHTNEPEPRDEAGNSIFGNFLVHNEATSEYICRFDRCPKVLDRRDRAIGHIRKHFQHRPFNFAKSGFIVDHISPLTSTVQKQNALSAGASSSSKIYGVTRAPASVPQSEM
ncbi:hypothetical protein PIIN_00804 [Serendipita indica DSM 11827]|uniref:C2H2-type domain-containing protein n=1 Tax=Serendipita indica (strain DSM 11827) TaxID=1109443 RepID=G4T6M4_SERID|nr:hypothetical protein PIIN_00804 [Serendipita indica DSM 11827]